MQTHENESKYYRPAALLGVRSRPKSSFVSLAQREFVDVCEQRGEDNCNGGHQA